MSVLVVPGTSTHLSAGFFVPAGPALPKTTGKPFEEPGNTPMWVGQRRWALAKGVLSAEIVPGLLDIGGRLGVPCMALLEGRGRENERSYLGFGPGWIWKCPGRDQDPMAMLRGWRHSLLDRLNWLGTAGDEGKTAAGTQQALQLVSGLMGYFDYEWGLVWHKPSATCALPRAFFRLCPINVVVLPQERSLVLEIFGQDAAGVAAEVARWSGEVNLLLEGTPDGPAVSWREAGACPAGVGEQGARRAVQDGLAGCPGSVPKAAGQDGLAGRPGSAPVAAARDGLAGCPGSAPLLAAQDGVAQRDAPAGYAVPGHPGWLSNMERAAYLANVEKIKEYIRAGDIFQAVYAQRFRRAVSLPPWPLYLRLRVLNPSPYLFCLAGDGEILVGSSPELLISTQGERVSTRPIAGTRPRGRTLEEDLELEGELRRDVKENAEHAMLVDLGRNDLGRVAHYGSVRVSKYAQVERFSHVMHLVSTVEGKLRPDCDGLDALRAAFPAGTLSGAPKVRAMEILAELEPEPRQAYGGALGICRWNGDVDFCITIRTLRLTGTEVSVQAGGGIVYDSLAARECAETLHKASALMKVVDEFVDGHR